MYVPALAFQPQACSLSCSAFYKKRSSRRTHACYSCHYYAFPDSVDVYVWVWVCVFTQMSAGVLHPVTQPVPPACRTPRAVATSCPSPHPYYTFRPLSLHPSFSISPSLSLCQRAQQSPAERSVILMRRIEERDQRSSF